MNPEAWSSASHTRGQTTTPRDRAVARLADSQHGAVSRRQLVALGLSSASIEAWVARGRLVRLHRGVYAVGHARLTRRGEWTAALLAVAPVTAGASGACAALSHRSAAAVHQLLPELSARVDVTTTAKRATTNWVEVHRTRTLVPADVCVRGGIPVTTVARTLVDLAGTGSRRDLARAVNEADLRGALDLRAVDAALDRTRGRNGIGSAALREILRGHRPPQLLRSELERRFAELLAAADLPRAQTNVVLATWEVDAHWPRPRLVVELDGWRFHRTRAAAQRDARKANALQAAGMRVLRYTWNDVAERPEDVVRELRAVLAEPLPRSR